MGTIPMFEMEPEVPAEPEPEVVALEQIGRKMSGGPEVGKGWRDDGTMYALDRAGRHGVAIPERQTYTKKHGANHSEDYETWGEAEVARTLAGGELAHTSGATGAAVVEPVAFEQNQRDEVRETEMAGSLNSQSGSKMETRLATASGVRRLTPTECERLQSFPDGWTVPPEK
jgi:site-specific DNA-cytosine methylase